MLNFGARVVSGLSRRDHVTPVLNELGWKCVDDLIRDSDVAVVSRLLTSDSAPQILRSKLVLSSDESARTTRATERGQLRLPRGPGPNRVRPSWIFVSRQPALEQVLRSASTVGVVDWLVYRKMS